MKTSIQYSVFSVQSSEAAPNSGAHSPTRKSTITGQSGCASPSPWGEGRGEGELGPQFASRAADAVASVSDFGFRPSLGFRISAFGLRAPLHHSAHAFTMIEIAISLAVIGFALIAIIGILPTGLDVQRKNREETIINQEAAMWIEAIRNGAQGMNDLTNYVDGITNYS